MVEVIIISHGQLAKGILDASSMIIGEQEKVSTLCLTPDQSVDAFKEKLSNLLNQSNSKEGVLILADLFGGTPANTAAAIADDKEKVEIITGINLPLLIELLSSRKNSSLEELVSIWKEAKGEGMKLISEILD